MTIIERFAAWWRRNRLARADTEALRQRAVHTLGARASRMRGRADILDRRAQQLREKAEG